MPAGMKPLEKFLKKQTTALSRAGGFGDKATGTGASRRRASLSRVVPFFRETSPESGPAREVFSPDAEEAPCWPSATADIRSPSLSSDEQSSEASLDTNWTPLPADTPDNLALALLDSVAGKRYGSCTASRRGVSQARGGTCCCEEVDETLVVTPTAVHIHIHMHPHTLHSYILYEAVSQTISVEMVTGFHTYIIAVIVHFLFAAVACFPTGAALIHMQFLNSTRLRMESL
ncbi:rap guanine nucleotide exchange factor-like 1 [Denticeps clupeoides]|uniref:rap guanine nucleotide exchange factor-like 1 n=1 Tax=Denticeps clupeoides TaxID=299321 RepID=UPI0010A411BD|nr:rap guanine nucleotide exchange factor-like 1 [Denticeps clupeoides]